MVWVEEVLDGLGVDSREYLKAIPRIPVHLRQNSLKFPGEGFRELVKELDGLVLEEERIGKEKPRVFRVVEGIPGKTIAHSLGLLFVQTLSSMLPPIALGLGSIKEKKGIRVLDSCAAPGAKTSLTAELMDNNGAILAVEKKKERVNVLGSNLKRMGVVNCCVWHMDSEELMIHEKFDYAIVDPPCSNLGTASGTERINPYNMEKLVRKQRRILENAFEALKPGGVLSYSTCTITELENEENIGWLMEKRDDAELDSRIAQNLEGISGLEKGIDGIGIRAYPHKINSEGFFVALVKKVG